MKYHEKVGAPPVQWSPGISLGQLRTNLAGNGPEFYIGRDDHGLVWAGPQQAMLVLGPPRSGKTSSLVVPNVLAAPGPVLVTSTKTDVLEATLPAARSSDAVGSWTPTGTLEPPPGLTRP
jgi:type IV secretory pathway TraG/TraD family ATPase VirD4